MTPIEPLIEFVASVVGVAVGIFLYNWLKDRFK